MRMRIVILMIVLLLYVSAARAQKFPERRIAREGNELFEQGDAEGAAAKYNEALKLRDDFTEVRYNLGNVMLGGEKIDEAIELYKQVLRQKPDDMDAKYNLAYAQKLKDEQQEQEQQDQQQEQQNEQDQSQGQEQPQGGNDGEDQQQEQPQQPQGQPQMSREDAENMLEAMQAEEDKTREEMDGEKVPAVGRSGKNW